MNCPSCGHLVSQHTDFYCLQVGCKCNISNSAAEARYWAVEMRSQLLEALLKNQWALQRCVELEKELSELKGQNDA